jgi:hypothetical protein
MADAETFQGFDAVLSKYISRPVRCVDGSETVAAGAPTLFGVMCRYAPSTRSLMVLNLLNSTATLIIEVDQVQLQKANELLTGRLLSFPLQLSPLEPMAFIL